MHFTRLAIVYWVVNLVACLCLFLVMVFRHRWRQFPALTLWMAFLTIRTLALMTLYAKDLRHWYTVTFLSSLAVDFILQLAVVVEIARIILRPTGTWVRDAWVRFTISGSAGIAVAALFAWFINIPPSPYHWKVWEVRSNLFTSLVICELFVMMAITANRLGLGWRSHVMAIGQGMTAWSTLMVVKTAMESYLGTERHFLQLEQIRYVVYPAAICWIILQLWRDEPERKPISPDLQEYILALHRRVEYDLRRLDVRH